jgi:hypothetical protein
MTTTCANPTGSHGFTPKATFSLFPSTSTRLQISDQFNYILCRQMDPPSTCVSSAIKIIELVVRQMLWRGGGGLPEFE